MYRVSILVLLIRYIIFSSRSCVWLIDEALCCFYVVLVLRGSKRCVLASRNIVKLRTTKGELVQHRLKSYPFLLGHIG